MIPKWMTKQDADRTKSDKRVKKIAKATGGRVVPNSGATPFAKGDISYEGQLVEHKMTAKQSFKLDKLILIKIYNEALKVGKEPVVMIDFGDVTLTGRVTKTK